MDCINKKNDKSENKTKINTNDKNKNISQDHTKLEKGKFSIYLKVIIYSLCIISIILLSFRNIKFTKKIKYLSKLYKDIQKELKDSKVKELTKANNVENNSKLKNNIKLENQTCFRNYTEINQTISQKIIEEEDPIKSQFVYDYIFFNKTFLYSEGTTKNKTEYKISLLAHSLEKGMASKKLRPFGREKVNRLMEALKEYISFGPYEKDYGFILGINTLRMYTQIYKEHNWTNFAEFQRVSEFLNDYKLIEFMKTGGYILKKNEIIKDYSINFDKFLSSRHSIRNYLKIKLSDNDIEKAVSMALKSPIACNRQMVKIYYIEDIEKRKELIKVAQGLVGFDKESLINLFVITFDINANKYAGERNQGWLNTGLVSMNFVNGLHSLGIGSCFIQFGNPVDTEEYLKNKLNIPKNERIGVIISAGYYAGNSYITVSPRKQIKDIYKKL